MTTNLFQIDTLPAQHRVLEALARHGFPLVESKVERGLLVGLPQTLNFFEEIAFPPGKAYSHRLNRTEVTSVATREKLHVVVKADRRVNPFADRDVSGALLSILKTLTQQVGLRSR